MYAAPPSVLAVLPVSVQRVHVNFDCSAICTAPPNFPVFPVIVASERVMTPEPVE